MDKNLIWTGEDLHDNWFYNKYYYAGSNCRYHTFQICLNLLNQLHPAPVIVETGCQRLKEDLGGGMSTSIFAEYLHRHNPEGGGRLYSIDISHANLQAAKQCVAEWPDVNVTLVCSDSVAYLEQYTGPSIDLLYLDSWDYPYEILLNYFGGQADIEAALAEVKKLDRAQALQMFGSQVLGCQEHTLREFKAAEALLQENCLVLIDDNQLAGGGKPRILKDYLADQEEWVCLLDWQGSLWLRSLR